MDFWVFFLEEVENFAEKLRELLEVEVVFITGPEYYGVELGQGLRV
jgi:hypothetical protein